MAYSWPQVGPKVKGSLIVILQHMFPSYKIKEMKDIIAELSKSMQFARV